MTLPFNEKVINDKKLEPYNFVNCKFVGYLNPYGKEMIIEILDGNN